MKNTVQNPLANPILVTAARLGVSRATLYRLMGEGAIKTIKIGHRTLVAEAELQRYVAERMAVSNGEMAVA
jgi:excisionase family DNA binding protein